eukprot:scaffold516_cov175-Amphora_coffeaeformis.AAC.29
MVVFSYTNSCRHPSSPPRKIRPVSVPAIAVNRAPSLATTKEVVTQCHTPNSSCVKANNHTSSTVVTTKQYSTERLKIPGK